MATAFEILSPPEKRRPRESGDPYAAAFHFDTEVAAFCNNKGRWLWVPAVAGTTSNLRSPRQRRFHHAAGFAEIHLPGVFRLQRADHLAHVLDPGGIGLGNRGRDCRLHVGLRHLLWEIGRDDRDLLALLRGELGAAALVVQLD